MQQTIIYFNSYFLKFYFFMKIRALHSSRAANLGYLEGSLLAGGELAGTLLSEHPPEH
jgi:hypothetical protein